MSENDKDRLKTTTPDLRDLIIRLTDTPNNNLPDEINLIFLGLFQAEAEALRLRSSEHKNLFSMYALVKNDRSGLLLSKPTPSTGETVKIIRPNKEPVGMMITSADTLEQARPAITGLIVDRTIPIAPISNMVITREGTHLFFRTSQTPNMTDADAVNLYYERKGMDVHNFTRSLNIRHFYAPRGHSISTPVMG